MKKAKSTFAAVLTDGVFDEGNPALAEVIVGLVGKVASRVMLVADYNVVQRIEGLGMRIGRYFKAHGLTLAGPPLVIGGGEKVKADEFRSVARVATAALESRIGHDDLMLVIGGGTLMDVAGYVAAGIRGGVRSVRLPTTPAAMLDGAFAEFAALDILEVKDALKIPYSPAAVVVDPAFAETVLDGVWRAGFGEAVRFALINDEELYRRLLALAPEFRARGAGVLREVLATRIVRRPAPETVDFAQWGALRLEAMSGWKLPHGYAVPIAICLEAAYAVRRGLMAAEDFEALLTAMQSSGTLDSVGHSRSLLQDTEAFLHGLDARRLVIGAEQVALPTTAGAYVVEREIDRGVYAEGMRDFVARCFR